MKISCAGFIVSLFLLNWCDAQSVEELLSITPDDANSIVIVRVDQMVGSSRGQLLGWADKHREAHANGSIAIPPWVNLLVRTSFVRPEAFGGDWTSFAVPKPEGFEMKSLADRLDQEVQELDSLPVVFSPRRNGYLADFSSTGSSVLGGLAPASRQEMANWIEDVAKKKSSGLSEFLRSAATSDAELVLAVDLDEMLDAAQIRYRLSGSPQLKSRTKERLDLTLDLQSLQGIQMAVHIDDSSKAAIRFEFKRTIGDEGKYLKDLLIDYLNDVGATLEELSDAEVSIVAKSVTLNFTLNDESLERILSLATMSAPPEAHGRSVVRTTEQPPLPGGVDKDVSLRYYRAVNRNVESMEKSYKRIQHYTQTARWHDTFASRIDELPIEGVDPELLDYGQKMSSLLRALGASLRGMGVNVDALNQQITYNVEQKPIYYNGADWWWGGAHTIYGPYNYGRPMETKVETNLQDVRAKQAEVVAKSQPEREKIWNMINEEQSVTRRAMVAKYGAEFQK